MRYTPSDLLGAVLVCIVIGFFGVFLLMWMGVPVFGDKAMNLINPSTGRPVTGAEVRRAEIIESDQKALSQYQETHRGEESPLTP